MPLMATAEASWRCLCFFFFSSRRRHTRLQGDWSSDVCSSDLDECPGLHARAAVLRGAMGAGAGPGDRPPLDPGRGPGWAKLAEAVALRVPPSEIETIYLFRPWKREGREWGTAVVACRATEGEGAGGGGRSGILRRRAPVRRGGGPARGQASCGRDGHDLSDTRPAGPRRAGQGARLRRGVQAVRAARGRAGARALYLFVVRPGDGVRERPARADDRPARGGGGVPAPPPPAGDLWTVPHLSAGEPFSAHEVTG